MPTFKVFKGEKGGKIVESSTTREVKPNEVLIRITHSGVCGTDEHYRESGCVLGHEGVGIAEEVGSDVTTIKKGELVGWGYVHGSCGHCKQCAASEEILCPEVRIYAASDTDIGSFASHAVIDGGFVYRVPEGMAAEHAAPLMCGGSTVYSALNTNRNVRPSDVVGVLGIGGLGHLAIQFAAKMGCKVVVFSSTDAKRDEALRLGATHFVATKGKDKLDVPLQVDHLVVTTSFMPDWSLLAPALAPAATIYMTTVSGDDFAMPEMTIVIKHLRVQGTTVAGRQVHREMLEFAARHDVKPVIETFPMSVEGATEAMEKLKEGKMRYRGVLVA